MPITEAQIRNAASAETFSRGEDYYRSGAVVDLQQRGDTLLAQVEGSEYEPYEVTIELAKGELIEADCTCPYDWGGYCKHIVAVLLTYLRKPGQVTQRPPVTELLAGLSDEELRALFAQLLSEQPRLVDWVETQVALKKTLAETPVMSQPQQRQTPIDPAPFRKQAQSLFRGYDYGDYYAGSSIAHQMSQLMAKASPFLDAGDGRNALLILEAITGPYVDNWSEFDDSDGEMAGAFDELGSLFTEAILSADLLADERKAWIKKLTAWQKEVDDYGVDTGFGAAIAAAEQGWDYPPLLKVLREGQITEKGTWEGESPWYADDLALARLNVLERQGRTTEYLRLAEAEGQTALYLTMLVKLGRGQEAVAYAQQYMTTTDEALALAQALREHNQPGDALKVAEQGLSLHGESLPLARWLRDFAAQVFQPELALQAAKAAFGRSPSLAEYLAAEAVASSAWPAVKEELLKQLAATNYAPNKIEIYLHEGMIDEAVKAVDKSSYLGYDALERVVDAATESHPDWVIRQCRKQAEEIMDGGKSQHYHHAIHWLEKARQAYLAAGQTQEWRSYLEGLITKHTRKYSLRPQLEALRKR
ncbi:MAG: SWIM zinc finger domain-containing protein [Anaerolineae bacterium]|nr:SWIM zinc finger domain-containing protein [Anaerolineales bacterium]MCQ3973135.1 SWIM zinc finger domain-containing protein [Anaerolineae bacterium]